MNTLLTREGQRMVALADTQSRVVLKAVSVARDLGERVVIVAGLTLDDRVIAPATRWRSRRRPPAVPPRPSRCSSDVDVICKSRR
jgi:hypothetical protein